MSSLRIVFCGTPQFAVPSLQALHAASEFSVEAVITRPDRPRGRGRHVATSAVKQAALDAGLHVYQPESIRSASAEEFVQRIAPDAVVIIAYGQIVPPRLIALPRLGWINLHASLLPRYRGAAPIHWAIANGETVTGLTTMLIDAGLDTGPILLQRELSIGPDETAEQLSVRMSELGAPLVVETLAGLARGSILPQPQTGEHGPSAPVLKREDGRIAWSRPARQIYDRMRGFTPWPGAFTGFRGRTCHLWGRPAQAATAAGNFTPGAIVASPQAIYVVCGEGSCLELDAVQIEGRKKVTAREFANGARLTVSDRFE